MPTSDRRAAARFLLVFVGVLALALSVVAARVAYFDPYWIFRAEPPWLAATGGASRLLDRQTRRAKTLQALDRDYGLALVGSSTVYHGLDPADVDALPPGESVFNAGISALIADELPVIAGVIASRPAVTRVVLGLDYFMFSRPAVPVKLDPALETPTGRLTARIGSVIGRYAISDAWLPEVAGGDDPGSWTRAGFRITPPLSAALTEKNDRARRRSSAPYQPETLENLREVFDKLGGRRLDVYLSPVSDAQRRVLSDRGLSGDFDRWRADVVRIAAERTVPLTDLSELGRRFPFDPTKGSTNAWLDNLHYTPRIGRLVLHALGLRRDGGPPPS